MRYATVSDVPRMVELARQEHASSPWSGVPFDADAADAIARHFICSMGHTAMVTDGSYLLGLVQPLGFSRQRIAMEYAWYATDGQGLHLLNCFESWAKSMGAVSVVAHDYTAGRRLTNVLRDRRGYHRLGEAWARPLEH